MKNQQFNYSYDDHTSIPFKLMPLKPSFDGDKNTSAHRHNYYELFIFTEGGGSHLIDFNTKLVTSKMVHIVPPGSVHLLRRNAFTKGFVLLFSRDFYHLQLRKEDYWRNEAFLSHQHFSSNTELPKQGWDKLIQVITFLQQEINDAADFQREIIGHYLNVLLYLILRHQNKVVESQQNKTVFQFLNLLNLHFQTKHKVKDYAELLGLHSDKLNILIRKQLAKTVGEVIKERLLLESKRLLMHSDLSIKEIAYFLGMEPTLFTRWIKNQCEYSPKELRLFLRDIYV